VVSIVGVGLGFFVAEAVMFSIFLEALVFMVGRGLAFGFLLDLVCRK
jgi:hypothetical protein